ncbi:hypothetical protein [Streptomyces sp. URMC 123]|uniref:hypothetical protein n=1 Tax=Streptomyces sp. URMC 123 TaxID=3423403 RepID=UPI003F19BC1A
MTGVRTRATALAGAALLVLTGATACGEREPDHYTVPKGFCGTTMDPALVTPLLPEGKRFRAKTTREDGWRRSCLLYVDGDLALETIEELSTVRPSTESAESDRTLMGMEHPRRVPIGEETLIEGNVYSLNPCRRDGWDLTHKMKILVQWRDFSPPVLEARMERFTRAYLPDGLAALGCERQG